MPEHALAAFFAAVVLRDHDVLSQTDLLAELAGRHLGELRLAFAAAGGVPGAHAAFDAVLRPVVQRVHARVGRGSSYLDALQEVRVHVLVVPDGRRPRLLEYTGHGALSRWLHVVATRHLLNLLRPLSPELPFEDAFFAVQLAPNETAEAKLVKAKYGDPVRRALGRAMDTLPERARAILWFALVDGLASQRIGAVYGVHRTTAARWTAEAMVELRQAVDRELRNDMGVRESELSSLVRAVLSQCSHLL